LHNGGECGCASAFGESFFLLEEHKDGAGDLFVIDGDNFVDIAGDERERDVARAADRDAIGDGGFRSDGNRRAGFARAKHGGKALWFDADNADFGIGFLQSAGDAADETTSPDGDDDGLDVGYLLEELKADSALTADHFGVVEGMNEGAAFFYAASQGFVAGLVVAGSVENDLCSVGPCGGYLDLRSGKGHDDLGADAALRGVEGYALGMIAGTGGDNSALALGFAEGEQLVERAALFKGAGALEILELEVQGQSGKLGEVMRELAGRNVNGVLDARARGLNADRGYGFQDHHLVQKK